MPLHIPNRLSRPLLLCLLVSAAALAVLTASAQTFARSQARGCHVTSAAHPRHGAHACAKAKHTTKPHAKGRVRHATKPAKRHGRHATPRRHSTAGAPSGSGQSQAGASPACEDGSEALAGGDGSLECEDGSQPTCADGSQPVGSEDGSKLLCEPVDGGQDDEED